MSNTKPRRADRVGQHRTAFDKNRKRILMIYDNCYLCGRIVDKSLPASDPMHAQVDHIIPIARGGHPSDINNLCLTHAYCNRRKSDKLLGEGSAEGTDTTIRWSMDWTEYRAV